MTDLRRIGALTLLALKHCGDELIRVAVDDGFDGGVRAMAVIGDLALIERGASRKPKLPARIDVFRIAPRDDGKVWLDPSAKLYALHFTDAGPRLTWLHEPSTWADPVALALTAALKARETASVRPARRLSAKDPS